MPINDDDGANTPSDGNNDITTFNPDNPDVYRPTPDEARLVDETWLRRDSMEISVETITPYIAFHWLMRNSANRPERQRFILQYASDLTDDAWVPTGDSFRWDVHPVLGDGQHRLLAILHTRVTLHDQVVVRGLPEDARDYFDQGHNRSVADVLTINGMSSNLATKVAAVTKSIIEWEHLTTNLPHTRHQALDYIDKFGAGIEQSATATQAAARAIGFHHGTLAALHFFVTNGPSPDADDGLYEPIECTCDVDAFIEGLREGAGLEPNDPVLVFRNWYSNAMRQANSPRPVVRHGALVVAWNAWAAGESLRTLRIPRLTGREPQRFPRLALPPAAAAGMFLTTSAE